MCSVGGEQVEAPALIVQEAHEIAIGAGRLWRRAELKHLPVHSAIEGGEICAHESARAVPQAAEMGCSVGGVIKGGTHTRHAHTPHARGLFTSERHTVYTRLKDDDIVLAHQGFIRSF